LKRRLLIAFGADIGRGMHMKPRVNVHFPWKLHMGEHCWVGERTEILNLEPVTMGNHVALAHDVYIAAAGHDITSPTMEFKNRPVVIDDGAWIATRVYLGPGVHVGTHAVVAAGAVVVRDVAPFTVVGGNPATQIGVRRLRRLPGASPDGP
jgi:putative colanic acid biosynthesis acetyltransferase WcaF